MLPFDSAVGKCRACGFELKKKQKSWCGHECSSMYERNHYWAEARAAAVDRDGAQCVKCGWVEGEYYEMCLRNGQLAYWSRAYLLGNGIENRLEVNHIKPRLGAGYGADCGHHLSNLETLCHKCHVKVTSRQRIDRSRAR